MSRNSITSRAKNSLSHMGKSSRGSRGRSSSSRSSSRRSSSSRSRRSGSSFLGISGLPSWAPVTLGVLGVCGLVYGLMQITPVQEFMEPVINDVGEFFGLTDDEGIDSMNITHDRTYSSVVGQ